MLDGMSDSIQRSRIENLHSREVDRQSPTGLIFVIIAISIIIAACTVVQPSVAYSKDDWCLV